MLHKAELGALLWEYWFNVNQEDLSAIEVYKCYDLEFPMPKVEAKLLQLEAEGCKFKLAVEGTRIIGFLMYHLAYQCLLIVEGLFVLPEYEGKGVGKGFFNSLGPLKRVFFQTRKGNPPQKLFDIFRNDLVKVLTESDNKITWEMVWECSTT